MFEIWRDKQCNGLKAVVNDDGEANCHAECGEPSPLVAI
jgi:hypothetical protein